MPVNREQLERLVATVPGFGEAWEKFLSEAEAKEPPWYLAMDELAHYVVESYSRGNTREFPELFSAVESLLHDPDPDLRKLIAFGLLEDIQNIASHRDFGLAVFRQWLGTWSLAVWDKIDAYMQRVAERAERLKPRWWQFWRRQAFDPEKALSRVENSELRKIIESNYRKMR